MKKNLQQTFFQTKINFLFAFWLKFLKKVYKVLLGTGWKVFLMIFITDIFENINISRNYLFNFFSKLKFCIPLNTIFSKFKIPILIFVFFYTNKKINQSVVNRILTEFQNAKTNLYVVIKDIINICDINVVNFICN